MPPLGGVLNDFGKYLLTVGLESHGGQRKRAVQQLCGSSYRLPDGLKTDAQLPEPVDELDFDKILERERPGIVDLRQLRHPERSRQMDLPLDDELVSPKPPLDVTGRDSADSRRFGDAVDPYSQEAQISH
jgi:hypothetical protein